MSISEADWDLFISKSRDMDTRESACDPHMLAEIQRAKKELGADTRPLVTGAHRQPGPFDQQTVAQALKGSKNMQNCLRLYYSVTHARPSLAIELGTNIGVSGAFLASALSKSAGHLHTFDASPYRLDIARGLHRRLGLTNVTYYCGLFQDTLPPFLAKTGKLDFAFVDGDHTREGTLYLANLLSGRLSSHALTIFDDITWSDGMKQAWDEIKVMPQWRKQTALDDMGYCLNS